MEYFKYYKRGAGELDTSNFKEIANQGFVYVDKLDEKTFMSLLAMDRYITLNKAELKSYPFVTKVKGYVAHLRGDKDVFKVADLYGLLSYVFINCNNIQHESTEFVKSNIMNETQVLKDLEICPWFTHMIGADSSVPKFFPTIQSYATKVRKEGKVVSLDYTIDFPDAIKRVVIVDDLVGGGATVQMLVDSLKNQGYKGEIYLWVAYNEGFHSQEFVDQFNGVYLGEEV